MWVGLSVWDVPLIQVVPHIMEVTIHIAHHPNGMDQSTFTPLPFILTMNHKATTIAHSFNHNPSRPLHVVSQMSHLL